MRVSPSLALGCLSGTLLLTACAGAKGTPTPSGPSEPAVPTYSVTATVFYDENGNGILDPGEAVRIPGVQVLIGSGSGTSAPNSGQAQVTGIQEGSFPVAVRTETVPPYFQPSPPFGVQVPGPSSVNIPLTLPLGRGIQPNVYLGYGDSITSGDGSSDNLGYKLKLQNLLGPYLGRAEVDTWGREGTMSREGATRTHVTLTWFHPAYTLILYGTNDWNDQVCQNKGPAECFTIDALQSIVEDVKDFGSLPVLATLTPVNPALAPNGRNLWIDDMNNRIKALAASEQATVADLNAAFKGTGNLPALFADDIHPNDAGYQVMAQGWFKGITRARTPTSSARRFGFRIF